MTALAVALLGLAALVAERGWTWTRRERVRARVRPASTGAPARRSFDRRALVAPLAGVGVGLALAGPVGGLVGAGLGVGARRLGSRRSHARDAALRDEQIADAASGLASALRAGMSVPQALGSIAGEAEPPSREDLDHLLRDLEVGVELDVAIAAWVDRVGTDDARLLGAALALHRRTGGDLPKVLDRVAGTIRERVAIAREVRGLTAQARLSGLILGLLPVVFFAFLWVTSKRDMQAALSTTAGIGAVAVGLGMELLAFLWIRRLLVVA